LTTVLATAFGATLAALLTSDQMERFGWRIPFVFGILIGPVAYYVRRHIDETIEFQSIRASKAPLREALSGSKTRLLVTLGTVVLCTVATYTLLFMPTYATRQLGLPAAGGFIAGLLTGAIQLVLIPLVGSLSDRHGRLPIALASAVAILVAAYPMFALLAARPSLPTLLFVQAVIGALVAGYLGGLPALMSELFPTRLRTTGLSISYALGVALFGGFAPFINAWLVETTGNKIAPSFYLMVAAAISIAALIAARRLGAR
jgi:MFS transporter, MHS family, proline/betaine transporter